MDLEDACLLEEAGFYGVYVKEYKTLKYRPSESF